MEFSSLIKFLENPQKRSGGTPASAICITTCNILSQSVGHSIGYKIKEETLELS